MLSISTFKYHQRKLTCWALAPLRRLRRATLHALLARALALEVLLLLGGSRAGLRGQLRRLRNNRLPVGAIRR